MRPPVTFIGDVRRDCRNWSCGLRCSAAEPNVNTATCWHSGFMVSSPALFPLGSSREFGEGRDGVTLGCESVTVRSLPVVFSTD